MLLKIGTGSVSAVTMIFDVRVIVLASYLIGSEGDRESMNRHSVRLYLNQREVVFQVGDTWS